jgi:hypothetical protein
VVSAAFFAHLFTSVLFWKKQIYDTTLFGAVLEAIMAGHLYFALGLNLLPCVAYNVIWADFT